MRFLAILPLAIAAACTPRSDDGNAATIAPGDQAVTAASAEPVVRAEGALGGAPATSRLAREAMAVVERYYMLIGEKKYREARLLWDGDGAASGGGDKAFAASFAPYSEYRATIGAPTEVRSSGGTRYVLVAADLRVKLRATGREQERSGRVMLRRSADPKQPNDRGWRIWGVDIRQR